jgi:hypothetical protein
MKPFDLEAAKRGTPIITRDGRKVKFIAHVPEATLNHRVVVLYGDVIRTFPDSGKYYSSDHESVLDLFMAPRKRTVWVNLYPENDAFCYDTEAAADNAACDDCWGRAPRIGNRAWPLEIEE